MIIFEGKSTQNRLQPASSKSPPTGGGQKSTQNRKKVGQEVKKAGQGAAESWPGGDPELARRRPRAGQKLARTGPKAGQKLAKKWPKSDQKVILLGGVAKMEVKNHAFSRMRHGLKPSFSDEIKGGYMIFVIFGGSRKSIQKLVQIWSKTGPKLAQDWPKIGQNLARI